MADPYGNYVGGLSALGGPPLDDFGAIEAMRRMGFKGNLATPPLSALGMGLPTGVVGGHVASGIASAALDAGMLPGDVYAGRVDPLSDEGIGRAVNMAGMVIGGGMPMAETGAIGVAGDKLGAAAKVAPETNEFLAPPYWARTGRSVADVFKEAARILEPIPAAPTKAAVTQKQMADEFARGRLPKGRYGEPLSLADTMTEDKKAAARAMGFDPDVGYFHGSQAKDIAAFDPDKAVMGEKAVFLTQDPTVAQKYGNYIYPVLTNAKNVKDVNWLAVNPDAFHNSTTMRAVIDDARASGHDAVRIRNINDSGGAQTQFAVLDPSAIRSRAAQFDPAKATSSDILAGLAGAGAVGGAAALASPDQAQASQRSLPELLDMHLQ